MNDDHSNYVELEVVAGTFGIPAASILAQRHKYKQDILSTTNGYIISRKLLVLWEKGPPGWITREQLRSEARRLAKSQARFDL